MATASDSALKHDHSNGCSHGQVTYSSIAQTLDEMDFERGVWSAAMNGEIERVKKYLDVDNGDPDAQDSSGYTALHYASRNGHRDTCKLLLDKGADPNIQTKSGVTPLHRAAYCQHANIVKLLLSHQADPTLTDDDGKSPLHKAAEKGNLEICQMLISVSPTVGEAMKDIQDYRDKMALDYVLDENTGLKELLRPVLRDSDVERRSCGEDDDDDEDEEERQRFRKELEESFGLRDDTDDDL
ncbi:ankyrin repeat domain-containing protein 39-like [Ptychodera flava]|uniref:ankyrin repeat domain-containing protein 39-like n=1 Tax=Ptychodera flava TaxID=63121 RepID=UPI00396A689C